MMTAEFLKKIVFQYVTLIYKNRTKKKESRNFLSTVKDSAIDTYILIKTTFIKMLVLFMFNFMSS